MPILDDKKEEEHIKTVLKEAKEALENSNSFKLHELSDQTIHSASIYQHTDLILVAVIIYSLNKIVTNRDRIVSWDGFVKRCSKEIENSIDSIDKNEEEFIRALEKTKDTILSVSRDMKQYVQEVLRKASVNKATKIHEHGISLARTSSLLGITEWEMLDYIGQRNISEIKYNQTMDIKKRAKMIMEFLK